MPITEAELAVRLDHITSLETAVAEFEAQIGFLMAERAVAAQGARAVEHARKALEPLPLGYDRGSAGQVVAIGTAEAQAAIREFWPLPESALKPRRRVRKPNGDLL